MTSNPHHGLCHHCGVPSASGVCPQESICFWRFGRSHWLSFWEPRKAYIVRVGPPVGLMDDREEELGSDVLDRELPPDTTREDEVGESKTHWPWEESPHCGDERGFGYCRACLRHDPESLPDMAAYISSCGLTDRCCHTGGKDAMSYWLPSEPKAEKPTGIQKRLKATECELAKANVLYREAQGLSPGAIIPGPWPRFASPHNHFDPRYGECVHCSRFLLGSTYCTLRDRCHHLTPDRGWSYWLPREETQEPEGIPQQSDEEPEHPADQPFPKPTETVESFSIWTRPCV